MVPPLVYDQGISEISSSFIKVMDVKSGNKQTFRLNFLINCSLADKSRFWSFHWVSVWIKN